MKISNIVNAGILLALALALASTASASEHAEAAHEDEGSIVMNAAQRSAQGIDTARVASRVIAGSITAPGEVRLNGYLTAQVTTRIPA